MSGLWQIVGSWPVGLQFIFLIILLIGIVNVIGTIGEALGRRNCDCCYDQDSEKDS